MQPFTLDRPRTEADAIQAIAGAEWIGGGTDMVQLLREQVRTPGRLVDTTGVLGRAILLDPDRLRIEAGATMEQVATDPGIVEAAPALSQALLESASVQVRNMATLGGNLLQRTRCGYFRDIGVSACNKRIPGSGCAARGGENRMAAILGTSPHCIATHASDFAVALLAFDASVHLASAAGRRVLPVAELWREPGEHPDIETNLAPGELITAIEMPLGPATRRAIYLKLRDRGAFEWALLSACVGLDLDDGIVAQAHVAMGGVGTVPWRFPMVEYALRGRKLTRAGIAAAVRGATEGAVALAGNRWKLAMVPRILGRAIAMAGDIA